MGTAAIVATAAGGLMQAYGQHQQSEAQESSAEFQAEMARRQARDARRRGEAAARKKQIEVSRVIGRQIGAFAGGGVQTGVGSAADVISSTAEMGQLDIDQVRVNAAREAWGFQQKAKMSEYQADAINAAQGPALAGSLLSTVGETYAVGKKAGKFGTKAGT